MSENIQNNIEKLKSMSQNSDINEIKKLLDEIKNPVWTEEKATKKQLQETISFLDRQIRIFAWEPVKANILNGFKADFEKLISNYGQEKEYIKTDTNSSTSNMNQEMISISSVDKIETKKSDYNFFTTSQISWIEDKEVWVWEKYKVEIVENNSYLKIRNIEWNVIWKLKKWEIVEIIWESVVFEWHKFLNIKSGDKQGFVAADYLVEDTYNWSVDNSNPTTTVTVKTGDTNEGTLISNQNLNLKDAEVKNKSVLIHKENIKDKNWAILSWDFERKADWKLHIINWTFAHTDWTWKVDIYKDGKEVDYTLEYMALMWAMVANDIASFTWIWTIPWVAIWTWYDAYDLTQKEDAWWQVLKKMWLVDNRYYAWDKWFLEYGLNVLWLVPGMTAALKRAKIAKFASTLNAAEKAKFNKLQSFMQDKFLWIWESAAKKWDIWLEYSKEANDLKKAREKAAKEKKSTKKQETNWKTTEKARENGEKIKKNLWIGENLVKFTDNKYIWTTLDLLSKELAIKKFWGDLLNIPVNLIRQPLITIRQAIETLLKKENWSMILADWTKLEKTWKLFKIALFWKKEFTWTLDRILSYAISWYLAVTAFNAATYTKEQWKESPAENLMDTIFNFLKLQHLWLPSMSRDLFMKLFEDKG